MKLQAIVPELLVEDVEKAIGFYSRVLGFHLNTQMPDSDTPVWAELVNGPARLMLLAKRFMRAQVPSLPEAIASGASVLLVTVGSHHAARDAYSNLQREVNILLPLREVGNGSVEFAFSDPDGNMIVIFGQ